MRFLCDEMLIRLGRWLRAAGYDTLIAGPAAADALLLAKAAEDARILLTRDRALVQRAKGRVQSLLLPDRIADQAQLLRQQLAVDWLAQPFTRCLMDNTPLEQSDMELVPEAARGLPGPFRKCPCCGRVYWPGSHVRRMMARLESWSDTVAVHPSGQAAR